MKMNKLAGTDLTVSQLCLGGNVFGWTASEAESFAVLDAYLDAGGNFIDTADVYSAWVPGHQGGESETILGRWMASRNVSNKVVIATKAGWKDGLSAKVITAAVEGSLRRLQRDYLDIYYAHKDDEVTPVSETLDAFDSLVCAGKVRYLGASNFSAARLRESLAFSAQEGKARYVILQPHYNLLHRDEYEAEVRALCQAESVSCAPYFGLARGFLTGKYREGVAVESARAAGASVYLNERGLRVLGVLDALAAAHHTSPGAVALSWLAAQPTVIAPIASARTLDQLRELLPFTALTLSADELSQLRQAAS